MHSDLSFDGMHPMQGRSDQIKSKLYGKMGKEIVQAVRAGGPDPTSNMRLRDLIAVAKER